MKKLPKALWVCRYDAMEKRGDASFGTKKKDMVYCQTRTLDICKGCKGPVKYIREEK